MYVEFRTTSNNYSFNVSFKTSLTTQIHTTISIEIFNYCLNLFNIKYGQLTKLFQSDIDQLQEMESPIFIY
jgi:hypothetical protein